MRRKEREIADRAGILHILREAKILHLGLFDGDYPYIVPLHYGYEYEDALIFFVHSAKEGHKLERIRENAHVCVALECDIRLLSGGDVPCKYSSAYASIIGQGKIECVKGSREKIKGLNLLMENQTGRTFSMDENMVSSVEVMKITIQKFTAKANEMH